MQTIPIVIRPPDLTDKSFIFNSWLKSYRGSAFAKNQCNEVYYNNYKKIVERALVRSMVAVACNPDDYTQVYGYIVYEVLPADNTVVHYIYVKFPYRRFKIAESLANLSKLGTKPFIATHYTNACEWIFKKYSIIYDPYILLESNYE
jgi:hypothetical protein